MNGTLYLTSFTKNELVLNEDETKIVLLFFFGKEEHKYIESIDINDAIRGFAQGLLVHAIDRTYGMGFAEAIFRSTANPTNSAVKVFKSFGKKALKHWFKHATANDLKDVQIYEVIRNDVCRYFKSYFRMVNKLVLNDVRVTRYIASNQKYKGNLIVWG